MSLDIASIITQVGSGIAVIIGIVNFIISRGQDGAALQSKIAVLESATKDNSNLQFKLDSLNKDSATLQNKIAVLEERIQNIISNNEVNREQISEKLSEILQEVFRPNRRNKS